MKHKECDKLFKDITKNQNYDETKYPLDDDIVLIACIWSVLRRWNVDEGVAHPDNAELFAALQEVGAGIIEKASETDSTALDAAYYAASEFFTYKNDFNAYDALDTAWRDLPLKDASLWSPPRAKPKVAPQ